MEHESLQVLDTLRYNLQLMKKVQSPMNTPSVTSRSELLAICRKISSKCSNEAIWDILIPEIMVWEQI